MKGTHWLDAIRIALNSKFRHCFQREVPVPSKELATSYFPTPSLFLVYLVTLDQQPNLG